MCVPKGMGIFRLWTYLENLPLPVSTLLILILPRFQPPIQSIGIGNAWILTQLGIGALGNVWILTSAHLSY